MIMHKIKAYYEVEGKVLKCKVTTQKDGEVLRKVMLEYGKAYKVIPDNKNKLKHRDKVGVLHGFKLDKTGNVYQARIKFDETNRIGYVDVADLHNFKNE